MFIYWISASLLCLVGNSFTIFATLTHKNIGIDNVCVVFIGYLAVADFMVGVTFLPMVLNDIILLETGQLSNLTEEEQISINLPIMLQSYGGFNRAMNCLNIISYTSNIVFIFGITLHRLYILKFPLKASTVNPRVAHIVAVAGCIVATIYGLYTGILSEGNSICGNRAVFRIREVCQEIPYTTKYTNLTFSEQFMICFNVIYYISFFGMVFANVLVGISATTYASMKHRSTKKPVVMTLLVSGLFLIGWTPFICWTSVMIGLVVRNEHNIPYTETFGVVLTWLEFFDYFFYSFSAFGNPIIYSCTNRRYKKFAMDKIKYIACCCCCRKKRANISVSLSCSLTKSSNTHGYQDENDPSDDNDANSDQNKQNNRVDHVKLFSIDT